MNELWWCMKQKLKQTLKPYKKTQHLNSYFISYLPQMATTQTPWLSLFETHKRTITGGERPTMVATPNAINDVTNTNTFSHRIIPESNTSSTVAHHLSCRNHHSNADDHREPTLTKADTSITLPRMTMFTAEFYFPVANPLLSISFYFII